MALPKTNISVLQVACMLGETTVVNRVSYLDTRLSKLCTSGKINRWSKYKPIRNNFTSNRPSEWWKSASLNCGVNIPAYASLIEMVNALRSDNNGWEYEYPTGGTNSPYRLGDFAGYDHTAPPPLLATTVSDTYYSTNNNIPLNGFATVSPSVDTWLGLNDMRSGDLLSNMYYGVCICNNGASSVNYMTSASYVANAAEGLLYPVTYLNTGVIEIFQFLTSAKKTSITDPIVKADFIPFPTLARQVSNLRGSDANLVLFAEWNNGVVTGYFKLTNLNASGLLYITGASIQLRYADSPDNSGIIVGEKIITIGDFTVTAGQTYTYEINTNALPDLPLHMGGTAIFNCAQNYKLKVGILSPY